MRSALLWFIGIPIPIILLLAYCTGHLWSSRRAQLSDCAAIASWSRRASAFPLPGLL